MKSVLKFLKPFSLAHCAKRYRHTARLPCKVCVVGANGVIGRHLALYMKMNSAVLNLTLYDTEEIEGLREDISHIDYNPWVFAQSGEKELHQAVGCSQLVIVVCGCRKQDEVDDNKLFETNAPIIMKIMEAIMESNRKQPFIHIITEPVNTLVPLAALALQKYEQYNERKLSGSTSIDLMRARLMYAEFLHVDPYKVKLPVIGGRSEKTIIPLLSVREPSEHMSKDERDKFLKRLRMADMDVMNAKCGEASAQWSVAVAASRFCYSVVEAICRKSVRDVAFIPCKKIREDVDYFSTRFLLEEDGVKEIDKLPDLDGEEEALLEIAIKEIEASCKMAKDYYEQHGNKEVKKDDCQQEKGGKKAGKEEKKTEKGGKKDEKKSEATKDACLKKKDDKKAGKEEKKTEKEGKNDQKKSEVKKDACQQEKDGKKAGKEGKNTEKEGKKDQKKEKKAEKKK